MKKIDDPHKQAIIALKKAQTHIKKVVEMIENESYCIDVMTQIAAANGLLKSASEKILKNHMRTCFAEGMETSNKESKERLIKEVLDVINLNGRK
jgi:CsoR family transcriptional regulator, copper-sensing transcriptional repressor